MLLSILKRQVVQRTQPVFQTALRSPNYTFRLYSSRLDPWLPWEDDLIRNYVKCNGKKWNDIVQHCLPHRTVKQCQSRWVDSLNPILKKGPFSPEEKELLEKGVAALGQGNWSAISQAYLPHRSARRLANEWSGKSALKGKKRWTKQEDELLLKGVEQFGTSAWAKISAELLPWRNRSQIRNHYRSNLDPEVIREKWSEHELDLLLRRTIIFGQDWNKVAEGIRGRLPEQCYNVWLNELDPSLNKGPWSDEETRLFWERLKESGGDYIKVSEEMPGRNRLSCFKKFWSTVKGDEEFTMFYGDQIKRHKSENGPAWRARVAKIVCDYLDNNTSIKKSSNGSIEICKSGPWDKDELAHLEQLVNSKLEEKKKLEFKDWKQIATQIDGRDVTQCKNQYDEHLSVENLKKGTWSKEEDELLKNLIEKWGTSDWDKIVEHIPNRNKRQCAYRWHRVLQYSKSDNVEISNKQNRLTKDEKTLIKEGVQMFGNNWKAIQMTYLPHKKPQQIMRWWHTYQKNQVDENSTIDRKSWTEEEDKVLQFAVDQLKKEDKELPSWAEVAKMVEGRTPQQCKIRWLYSLDSSKKKGLWSYEEQMQLFEIVQKYKFRTKSGESIWSSVAKELNNGRSDWACRLKYAYMQRTSRTFGR